MTLAEMKRRLVVGTRFTCIENTYRPELNGQLRVVTKRGATYIRWRPAEIESARDSWTDFPKAAHITASTDDRVTFRLFPDRPDTVTFEIPASALTRIP